VIRQRGPCWNRSHTETRVTQAQQGASLDVRTPGGHLRQIPWTGLINYPGLLNIVEPSVAW
jgi:hypothetical protein